jgi:hypothetical protein
MRHYDMAGRGLHESDNSSTGPGGDRARQASIFSTVRSGLMDTLGTWIFMKKVIDRGPRPPAH